MRARGESRPQECRGSSPPDVECPGKRGVWIAGYRSALSAAHGHLLGTRVCGDCLVPSSLGLLQVTPVALTSTSGLLLPPPVSGALPRDTPCSRHVSCTRLASCR